MKPQHINTLGKHVCEMYIALNPTFIWKNGFAGVYLNRLGEVVLTCTHNVCFEQK